MVDVRAAGQLFGDLDQPRVGDDAGGLEPEQRYRIDVRGAETFLARAEGMDQVVARPQYRCATQVPRGGQAVLALGPLSADPTIKALQQMGLIDHRINFLGDPTNARASVIAANVWRGIPFVAITLLAGLQTISPSLYEAATLDGATGWQRFWHVTLPMLTPIIAVVMTFSVLFTFTDFQLIYVLTRGGPVNATHLMATLSFQRAIPGGHLGEGAAIAVAMIPFLLAAILFSYFGMQRRRWQQGGRD